MQKVCPLYFLESRFVATLLIYGVSRLQERKYFDSGDYALSKAGKEPQENVGTAIPQPEK